MIDQNRTNVTLFNGCIRLHDTGWELDNITYMIEIIKNFSMSEYIYYLFLRHFCFKNRTTKRSVVTFHRSICTLLHWPPSVVTHILVPVNNPLMSLRSRVRY